MRLGRYAVGFVLIAMMSGGCYRMTIQDAQSEISPPKTFVEFREGGSWSHYMIGGIVPLRNGKVDRVCDEPNFDTIHMRTTFLNGLMWSFTNGIYTPQSVVIICNSSTETDTAAQAPSD